MAKILNPGQLEFEQMRAILQGMVHVARADGENAAEVEFIREYYDACRSDVRDVQTFEELRRDPYDLALLRAVLTTSELKQSLLGSCLLVAYVDGQVSEPEQSTIAELVRTLDIDEAVVAATHERIKELLLTQLSRVSDLETLKNMAGTH